MAYLSAWVQERMGGEDSEGPMDRGKGESILQVAFPESDHGQGGNIFYYRPEIEAVGSRTRAQVLGEELYPPFFKSRLRKSNLSQCSTYREKQMNVH